MNNSEARHFGLIGLGTMGRNLAYNMFDHDIALAVYSISAAERRTVREQYSALPVCDTTAELLAHLAAPRTIFLMVTAGPAVDELLDELLPMLAPGDLVMDGGNSSYLDTERRSTRCAEAGIDFMGVGISGGEEGARHGASVMAGGDQDAFTRAEPLLQAIATEADGEPCYGWLGTGGAGHFVKAVHNGIEYGVMQLIAESYDLLSRGSGLAQPEVAAWFAQQRGGRLDSYLLDITAGILTREDEGGSGWLLEKVKDVAEQKGTGRWCIDAALQLGVPVPTIVAAVTERQLSNQVAARGLFAAQVSDIDRISVAPGDLADGLYFTMLATFAQGLELIRTASTSHGWGTQVGVALRLWRGGCIIRAALLQELIAAADRADEHVLLDADVLARVVACLPGCRRVVAAGLAAGVPLPAMASALNYFDSMRSARLPTHLIQAQRDCFGAHQFERVDQPGRHHADWLGVKP